MEQAKTKKEEIIDQILHHSSNNNYIANKNQFYQVIWTITNALSLQEKDNIQEVSNKKIMF